MRTTTPETKKGRGSAKHATRTTHTDDTALAVPAVVWQSQKVITTELLAKLYGTHAANIQKNHERNLDRFSEGKHFFKLEGEALRECKRLTDSESVSRNARSLILWTERGAARHAKMLETDAAWDVFETLEDTYFRQRASVSPVPSAGRIAVRRAAAANYNGVSEILAMRREAEGKATLPHHFANEARLINFALVGNFLPVNRDDLSDDDLRILNRLEIRDMALIGMGKSYDQRKAMLAAYASHLRQAGVSQLTGALQ
ncbi:ORF6N domain-containing protein [Robbsia andropogonis]|uniref:ORF6N domain-containing protein n=1 Tax=Robbsia andropogonis TaxID=28092 RepID=UPI003D21D3B9